MLAGKCLDNFKRLLHTGINVCYYFQYLYCYQLMRNFVSINIICDRNSRENGIVLSKLRYIMRR